MKQVKVTISGAQWGAGMLLLLNPNDHSKQGWYHHELIEGGEELLKGYSKGRKTVEVRVRAAVAEDLGI